MANNNERDLLCFAIILDTSKNITFAILSTICLKILSKTIEKKFNLFVNVCSK